MNVLFIITEVTNRNVDESLSTTAISYKKDFSEQMLPESNETSNAVTIPEKQLEENTCFNDEQQDDDKVTTVLIKTEKEESTPELDSTNDDDISRKRKRKARPKKVTSLVGFPVTPKTLRKERRREILLVG